MLTGTADAILQVVNILLALSTQEVYNDAGILVPSLLNKLMGSFINTGVNSLAWPCDSMLLNQIHIPAIINHSDVSSRLIFGFC
jgi:hypothetical protein